MSVCGVSARCSSPDASSEATVCELHVQQQELQELQQQRRAEEAWRIRHTHTLTLSHSHSHSHSHSLLLAASPPLRSIAHPDNISQPRSRLASNRDAAHKFLDFIGQEATCPCTRQRGAAGPKMVGSQRLAPPSPQLKSRWDYLLPLLSHSDPRARNPPSQIVG